MDDIYDNQDEECNDITNNIILVDNNDMVILTNLSILSKIQPYQKLLIKKYDITDEYDMSLNDKNVDVIDFDIKIDKTYVQQFFR